jgi:calpain-13
MVRFYKFLKEVYITIDDYLPINNYDEFVFARSEDPMEIWPCILEKAYAKLYSGYDKIVEGKCHRVFAELTGGFPSEILVESYRTNPNGLWQKLINAKGNNYLLAAGSPPNAQGDSVASKRGIVQGHAYSVLDAKEI